MAMNPKLLRPRASGFNPKSIAGLQLWLDGADSSTITLNGTNVSAWSDKSGKGNNFAQPTASQQPSFTSSARNGRSAVYVNSNNTISGPTGFSFAQPTTWFLAFQAPTSSGSWSIFDGDTARQHVFGNSQTEMRMFAGSSPVVATIVGSSWYVAILTYSGTSSTHRISTRTASTVSAGTNSITAPRVGSSAGIRGNLGEIGVFNRAISQTEAEAMLKYLGTKWAVTVS